MTRLMPSRLLSPKPARIKRQVASLKHVSAPLKGLSLSSKLTAGDPLTATVLDNWIVEEAQIKCRPGTRLIYTYPTPKPVETMVPFYGQPDKIAAAVDGKLILLDGTVIKDGFTGNDWSWTSFSNLSAADYTVMVNGVDGVWSWDGNEVPDPGPVGVVNLTNANPAVCTVSPTDIGKFSNGMVATIAGATGVGMTNANGPQLISSVGTPANSFTLVGVDTSTGSAPQTIGVMADPPGSMMKELITAPPGEPWVVPDQLNIVLSHMNRLWFADSANLAVYYLPIQQKSGQLAVLPLNALFKRGGSIRAMYTWTTDGAINLTDQLVIFSTNGECVIYSGVDPGKDGDFQLTGIFRFDSPMSKHSVVNYGGELYVLISTGMVPMSTLMRAESEQLGKSDQNVFSSFFNSALKQRGAPGWQAFINPSSGRIYCNMPQGGKTYTQMIRFMPNPIWGSWSGLQSRCWGWVADRVFFGTDDGKIFEMHPNFLNDNGRPIRVDVQAAWSNLGTPAAKHFKMVLPYITTDGTPRPFVDVKVDYDYAMPVNQPDVTFSAEGANWDTATWDVDAWAGTPRTRNNWTGVGIIGRVGAPRLVALVSNCEFSLTGWDVLFEGGSIFG